VQPIRGVSQCDVITIVVKLSAVKLVDYFVYIFQLISVLKCAKLFTFRPASAATKSVARLVGGFV